MNPMLSLQRCWWLLLVGPIVAAALAAGSPPSGGLLRTHDVVALLGGEDMAATWDYGFLEYLIVRQRPDLQLKFRSLTKEGDTAFQQARDFNYPALEKQLAEIDATVVVIQMGLLESLRGKEQVTEFERAADAWIDRIANGRKRRVVLVGPAPLPASSPLASRFNALESYREAVARLAQRKELPLILPGETQPFGVTDFRDGLHLNERGHFLFAAQMADVLAGTAKRSLPATVAERQLLVAVRSKNLRWYHYVRPQNWAFLDGDRTVQPASRDHRDPEKRWFPEEMKEWARLVTEKEREMWSIARQLDLP